MKHHEVNLIVAEFVVIALGPIASIIFREEMGLIILGAFFLVAVACVIYWFKLYKNTSATVLSRCIPVALWVFFGFGISVWGTTIGYPHF